MSFTWYFSPDFKAPYRSDNVEECCVLAYNYFSTLVDDFVEKLPEHRLPFESDDYKPTLANRVHLIFLNGFGEYDEEKNHNPCVWPVLLGLCDAVHEGTSEVFAKELCEAWGETFNADGQYKDQTQVLQRIFDYITSYLQLFVVMQDAESMDLDFKYPPKHESGILISNRYRNADAVSDLISINITTHKL